MPLAAKYPKAEPQESLDVERKATQLNKMFIFNELVESHEHIDRLSDTRRVGPEGSQDHSTRTIEMATMDNTRLQVSRVQDSPLVDIPVTYMAMSTLDLTLVGTTSLRRDTATGMSPPGVHKGRGGQYVDGFALELVR